ncbi:MULTISPECIES: hypothetical protein [Sphingobacterium]|uniref:hypothetical protein n=1 Tax=Sphingobacterium TaxID=28453 RepID=UPI001608EC89|nr:hypothetical protein [Sphingobacterium sp. JUb56]MBB2950152.1 hypothetical protein [Sphingobacterium sp. JUb56]
MKKKSIFSVFAVLGLGIAACNFVYSNASSNDAKSTISALNNLQVLNASAGESYCKDNSSNSCEITSGGVTIKGTGQPYTNN